VEFLSPFELAYHLGGKRPPDFPVVPEGIDHPAYSPAVPLADRVNLGCTSRERPGEHLIRIRYRQDHPNRTTSERLGAEVAMLWRFITLPKLRTVNGESCHHAPVRTVQSIDLRRAKSRFVELESLRTISDR
jgi:hypothetical protein